MKHKSEVINTCVVKTVEGDEITLPTGPNNEIAEVEISIGYIDPNSPSAYARHYGAAKHKVYVLRRTLAAAGLCSDSGTDGKPVSVTKTPESLMLELLESLGVKFE
jgi:dihydroxyacetone kinase